MKVKDHEAENKMGVANLATIFGPNLMRALNPTEEALLSHAPLMIAISECLIIHCESLLQVGFLCK